MLREAALVNCVIGTVIPAMARVALRDGPELAEAVKVMVPLPVPVVAPGPSAAPAPSAGCEPGPAAPTPGRPVSAPGVEPPPGRTADATMGAPGSEVTGALDDASRFKPRIALFMRDRPDWVVPPDGLTAYDTMPG